MKRILAILPLLILSAPAFAASGTGTLELLSGSTDAAEYNGYDDIIVYATAPSGSTCPGGVGNCGSLVVTKVNGGKISINDTLKGEGDFLHDGRPVGLGYDTDPYFYGQGSIAFTGDNALVHAPTMDIGRNFINGNGTSAWDLRLEVDKIVIGQTFKTETNSKLVIAPIDYANAPHLTAKAVDIADGIKMGGTKSNESVFIESAKNTDIYKITGETVSVGTAPTKGDVIVDMGKLEIMATNHDDNRATYELEILGNAAGNMLLAGEDIYIGGNLGAGVDFDADYIHVHGNVLHGVQMAANKFRNSDDAPDNGGQAFKPLNLTVDGTYYFDDTSKLQLVFNNSNYNGGADAPLIVGGFNAGAAAGNAADPGIEVILDDGLFGSNLSSIKLIECATPGCALDLGGLEFAGIYFYDAGHNFEFFQDATLLIENDAIWAKLALMREIAPIVARTGAPKSGNDMQMALAIDDLIHARLAQRGWNGDVESQYSGVMRDLFRKDDVFYQMMLGTTGGDNALSVMIANNPERARGFVKGFGLNDAGALSSALDYSSKLFRRGVSDQLMDDFPWQRYHDKKVAWGDVSYNTIDHDGSIINAQLGADWQVAPKWVVGGNVGYNFIDSDLLDGGSFNIGAYGTWRALSWAKVYGTANLTFHSIDMKNYSRYAGKLKSSASTTDAVLQLGLLHKIYDSYITGRAYADIGWLGGYKLKQSDAQNRKFMNIKTDGAFDFTPGYEITLGKDIWFSYWSFMRPKLRFGIEYEMAGRGDKYKFQFAGAGDQWRNWKYSDDDSRLWIKYGGGIDFSFFGPGTNLGLSYEISKNGDFKSTQYKLDGSIRF